MLEAGVSSNTRDTCSGQRRTALHIACARGHYGSAQVLLQHNARCDAREKVPAAMCLGLSTCAVVLTHHVVARPQISGWTPLHSACAHGQPLIAKALIEAGAHVDAQDRVGAGAVCERGMGSNYDVTRRRVWSGWLDSVASCCMGWPSKCGTRLVGLWNLIPCGDSCMWSPYRVRGVDSGSPMYVAQRRRTARMIALQWRHVDVARTIGTFMVSDLPCWTVVEAMQHVHRYGSGAIIV